MKKILLISLLTLSLSIALTETNQSQGKSKYISVKDDIEKIKEDLAKIYNNDKYYDGEVLGALYRFVTLENLRKENENLRKESEELRKEYEELMRELKQKEIENQ